MKKKKIPERMCIGCKEIKTRDQLLRLVVKEDLIDLDLINKANGKGAYVCISESCVDRIFSKNTLPYYLKAAPEENLHSKLLEHIKTVNRRPKSYRIDKNGNIIDQGII